MRTDRGFTLPEVMISIVLLALVWIAVVDNIIVGKVSGSRARHKIQAMAVVQRAIEDLHKKPFSQIASGTTQNVIIDDRGTPYSYSDDLNGTRTITVTNMSIGGLVCYKKAIVRLGWTERSAIGRAITMTEIGGTYIPDDPQAN